ncbi:MAG: glycoside hydrolase family 13 protein [Promethearchaeota archaeon]
MKIKFKRIIMGAILLLIAFNPITRTLIRENPTQLSGPKSAQDNDIQWDPILHDTQDGFYRSPGWGTTSGQNKSGAVPVGTDVRMRIRTAASDVQNIQIRYWDGAGSIEGFISMYVALTTNGYDYWEGNISSPAYPSDYYYHFILTDGSKTVYYQDNDPYGGPGQVLNSISNGDLDFGLVFYDPNFKTPDWNKNAIGYQIFPDSFNNGDPSNDPVGNGGNSGDVTWWEWDSNGDNSHTSADSQRTYAKKLNWGDSPQGGNGFFGGDLQGVANKAEYLESLGIKLIWFNPICESPDNHGYSVNDYNSISPYLGKIDHRYNEQVINNASGSLKVFDDMNIVLHDHGIKPIFDAVLNHVSAQSKYFQRYETDFGVSNPYASSGLGAYQGSSSPYYDWFKFYHGNYDYDAWWGFLNIPTLMYEQAGGAIENELISGDNSLFKFWNNHNIGGYRLDVPNMYQDGQGSRYINQLIRTNAKADNPDNIVIGEIWGRANAWLTGTMEDGVQNMPFGESTIAWVGGNAGDDTYTSQLIFPQENYPPQAFYSLWTILGNHDTPRVLNSLGGDTDKVLMAATIQFTYPGVPMIYYGDEVGLGGAMDPDNRRAYPWGHENQTMLAYYQKLSQIRTNNSVLRTGSFEILPDNTDGFLAYGRELPGDEHPDAVILINRLKSPIMGKINLTSLTCIEPGDILIDQLHPNLNFTVTSNKMIIDVIPANSALILLKTSPTSTISNGTNSSNNPSGFKIPGYALGIIYISFAAIGIWILVQKVQKNKKK